MSTYQTGIQHNFLNKYSRLSPTSNEWARIEYLLQLSLSSTTAVVKNIWSIANPHMTLSFEKQSKGLLVLESWLDASLLDENNRVEKVCNKGFQFPPNGLKFPTGNIRIQDGNIARGRIYEFFMLQVAVGKSYCLPANNQQVDKYKLPFGFDSIYLYTKDDDPSNGFKHDYIIYENSRVLPCYMVHFEFDLRKEDGLTPPICDICNEIQATVYCKADDMGLCYECDEEHHLKGGKLVSKHQRVPISEKPKSFGSCPVHPEQKLELYCTIDHQPICVYCKIAGSHSQGESSVHPLVKIQDAYQKAIIDSKEIDPLIEKRKNQLADLLEQINTRIKDVNKNASFVEESIYQALQQALLQLQEETQKKMSFLIGDQLELKRQYDHIQWMESFLKYQQEVLPPSDYLNSWSRHMILRNELIQVTNLPVLTNVQADIRLEGKVNVITDGTNKNAQEQALTNSDFQDTTNQLDFDQNSQIGTTRFRSAIFNKHQVGGDKNQKLIKSLVQQSIPKGPQQNQENLSWKSHRQQNQGLIPKYQPTIEENQYMEQSGADSQIDDI